MSEPIKMYLFKLTQYSNIKAAAYDSAVVAAFDEVQARYIHPSGIQENYDRHDMKEKEWYKVIEPLYNDWVKPEEVHVRFLGPTIAFSEPCVVCSSYNDKKDNQDLFEIFVNNTKEEEISDGKTSC